MPSGPLESRQTRKAHTKSEFERTPKVLRILDLMALCDLAATLGRTPEPIGCLKRDDFPASSVAMGQTFLQFVNALYVIAHFMSGGAFAGWLLIYPLPLYGRYV